MEYLGSAAGATVGYIVGNVPGLVAGAKYGFDAGKTYQNSMQYASGKYVRAPAKRKASNAGVVFGATYKRRKTKTRKSKSYVGKRFARKYTVKRTVGGAKKMKRKTVNRKKNKKRDFKAMALSKGSYRTTEQYGNVTSQDCVYIAHSSGHLLEMSESIAGSVLRKLLDKAGFKINQLFRKLDASNPGAGLNVLPLSGGLRFSYNTMVPITGETFTYVYDPTGTNNFGDILNNFTDFKTHIYNVLKGENAGGAKIEDEPYKVALFKQDTNNLGIQEWRLAAELFLEDLTIELQIGSHLVVQNRTQAANASAGVNDADRIDNQPLKGWMFDFKHADPRVRVGGGTSAADGLGQTNQIFNNMPQAGINLIRGNQFGPSNEPLHSKYFANSLNAMPITLAAGEMRKTSFYYHTKGKLVNLLKKLRCHSFIGGAYTGQVGKSQMISFEETMRTSSSNLVNIAYEREYTIGSICRYSYSDTPLPPIIISVPLSNTE